MLAALLGAKEAVAKTLAALAAGERRFGILGTEGSGKSAALDAIADDLAAKNETVHRLAITRGDDAACVGMVALAGHLDPADRDLFPIIRDGRVSYAEKLKRLEGALEGRGGTLLVDDPPFDRANQSTTIFDDRLAELNERLLQLRDVRVVVSSWRGFAGPSVTIHPRFDASSVLASLTRAPFRDAAMELVTHPRINLYSPVEVRLVVAAVAANRSASELTARRWDPSDLLDVVLEGDARLRVLVGTLALARVPFDDDLLGALGVDGLEPRGRSLLDEILLIRTPAGRVVHGLIARRARANEWIRAEARTIAHQSLAAWSRRRFEAAKSAYELAGAFAHEVEMIHHLTEAGDIEAVLAAPVYFSEQYDALGKALSVGSPPRYSEAVRAYERAITFDEPPDRIDTYAHHYLAYNLDVLGQDMVRVREEYRVALEVQPTHPWYWNRFICFLITTGYLDQAMDLWSEAAACFQLDRGQEWIALELHRNVAHLLTYRGQLGSARRVLGDAPRGARGADWYVALDSWLNELEAAERQELVFPPHLEPDERWQGPHLLRHLSDKARVADWSPGYIASSDAGGVRLRFARRTASHIVYGYRDLSVANLEQMSSYPRYGLQLPAGTFVEILKMKTDAGDTIEQLLSWPRQTRRFPGLPPIFPAPDRYIRRALAGR